MRKNLSVLRILESPIENSSYLHSNKTAFRAGLTITYNVYAYRYGIILMDFDYNCIKRPGRTK